MFLACTAHAAEGDFAASIPPNTAPLTLWSRAAAEPVSKVLQVGDRAPAFSYLGTDGRWHRFADLAGQGPVLLVFGASDVDLKALESARPVFRDLGLLPVAVLDMRTGSAMTYGRRLGLTGPIITDPMLAVADLFNSINPVNLRHAPSFFVVDAGGTIRALRHGSLPPVTLMLGLSAHLLGRPLPESAG